MDRKDFHRKVWAGTFFLTGLIVIGVVVLAIGIEKGITVPKYQLQILFREVGGLSSGAPVYLSGVSVGTVGKVELLDEEIEGRGVKVTLNVFRKYQRHLEKSSRFSIKTKGVLGEKSVEIARDANRQHFDFTKPVLGEDPLDVQDLAKLFGDTAINLQQTSRAIGSLIKEINRISYTSKRLLNRIEQRIIDGNLFKVF